MRLTASLSLPLELEQARLSGDLVIFAGAGVSMGQPAGLPSFEGLARQIAKEKIPWDARYTDNIDRYLGQAERELVDVQGRARRILRESCGNPTPLHEHLLGVFASPERVRLITTNFDRLFNRAATSVFSADVRERVGPALPPPLCQYE
jgi:NAD-dependent SIR2 family protein deacetylase